MKRRNAALALVAAALMAPVACTTNSDEVTFVSAGGSAGAAGSNGGAGGSTAGGSAGTGAAAGASGAAGEAGSSGAAGASGAAGSAGAAGTSGAAGSSGMAGASGTAGSAGAAGAAGSAGGMAGAAGSAGASGTAGSAGASGMAGAAGGATFPLERVASIHAGELHTCVLTQAGKVRCWGRGQNGRLGYGNTNAIGDNEPAKDAGDVDVGADNTATLSVGDEHQCVLLMDGGVRCWGQNNQGSLGYGNLDHVGDDELPSTTGNVYLDIKARAYAVTAGGHHSCAIVEGGKVLCWGWGLFGALGYGSQEDIGDDEPPVTAGHVSIGGFAIGLASGKYNSCAIRADKSLICWGSNDYGVLGHGDKKIVGDKTLPADAGPVALGSGVEQVDLGSYHACAIMVGGGLRCWGQNGIGQLGLGNTESLGDDELPSTAPTVALPGIARSVCTGSAHSCVTLTDGKVYCWGSNFRGQLGYPGVADIGATDKPSDHPAVDIGEAIQQVTCGRNHTCALSDSGKVYCWGGGIEGALGYGNKQDVGKTNHPKDVGPVPVFDN